jgi:mono/diheme cytochrome c family protein
MRVVMSILAAAAWVALVFVTARTVQPTVVGAASLSGAVAVEGGASPASPNDDSGGDRINGRKLFLKNNCYTCHGGRGGGGMCLSLRANPADAADAIGDVLPGGNPAGMPSFRGFVTDRDIRDLAAYIRSLRTSQEPTFTHWWEAVPSQ